MNWKVDACFYQKKRKKLLRGKWVISFENTSFLTVVRYRHLGICYLLHKGLPTFQKQMCLSPLFGILEKHSINKCQSGERCLFMRLKRITGSWCRDTFGMKAMLYNVLTSKPSFGRIGTERRMSLRFVDKPSFQFLIVIIVLNTVENSSFV